MRAGMKPEWLCDSEGRVIAISLGADFVSEHEWGIKGLKRLLGTDGQQPGGFSREKPKYTKPHGIGRRTITTNAAVKLFEHKGEALLLCQDDFHHKYFEESIQKHGMDTVWEKYLPQDLRGWRGGDLATAWDEQSFGILAKKENVEKLRDIFRAFQGKNIAIWVGPMKLFENGGLVLCILDRAPADCVETMRAGDENSEKLQAASDATGIIKRLNDAKKGFYACSPRWVSEDAKKKSAHPVMYFLNPEEQDRNNSGWFTVEDLDQWIKGTGPIPMKAEAKR